MTSDQHDLGFAADLRIARCGTEDRDTYRTVAAFMRALQEAPRLRCGEACGPAVVRMPCRVH